MTQEHVASDKKKWTFGRVVKYVAVTLVVLASALGIAFYYLITHMPLPHTD